MYKLYREKNENAKSFTNKNEDEASSMSKKKSAREGFHEENQFHERINQQVSRKKISTQQVP